MIRQMSCIRRVSAALFAAVVCLGLVGSPRAALAQSSPEWTPSELQALDGRVRGYETMQHALPNQGPALTYFALIGLMLLGVGVMFKSSRRTHLD